jgi:hypothetical protein
MLLTRWGMPPPPRIAEAMIEKAIREPQHMINRARATLPQKIGFEVAQQFVTFGLRRSKRWPCHHSYLNEMRNEQPGKIDMRTLIWLSGVVGNRRPNLTARSGVNADGKMLSASSKRPKPRSRQR